MEYVACTLQTCLLELKIITIVVINGNQTQSSTICNPLWSLLEKPLITQLFYKANTAFLYREEGINCKYVSLVSVFPPVFKEKIHDKAYNVGDSCTLKVHVIGNPPPVVTWYRNEELLSEGGRVRLSKNSEGRHTLTILQTKPHDFGVFKCVARNKYGTVTCRARMLMGGKDTSPPFITV